MSLGETGIVNISGVGEIGVGVTGVSEMGQIVGETGVGGMGCGETGTSQIVSLHPGTNFSPGAPHGEM